MQNDTQSIRKNKKWHKNKNAKTIAFFVLFVVSFIFLLPIFYMVGTSFKTSRDISLNPTKIFPSADGFTWTHYKAVIFEKQGDASVLNALKNSLIVSCGSVLLAVIVDSLAAYAFTFLKFKNRVPIYTFVIFSMTIPGIIGTTIRFAAFANAGQAINAMDAAWYLFMWLIIPGAVDVYHVFLLKNYFDSIPFEVVESARSDGASDFKIYRSIIFPLGRSTLLLIGMFTFTTSWNNLFWASLVAGNNDSMKTITVYLQNMSSLVGEDKTKGKAMAASVVSLVPILIVFMFMQNKMIDGLASTGVKK